MFVCELIVITNDINSARNADINPPYTVDYSIEEVTQELENASKSIFKWFSDNYMKTKPDKYHFVSSSNSEISITVKNLNILSIKYIRV